MKKYIREGLGEDIETFLEWFLSQNQYDNVTQTGGHRITAVKLGDNKIRLEFEIKLFSIAVLLPSLLEGKYFMKDK